MLPIKTLLVVLQDGRDDQPAWLQAQAWAQVMGAHLEVLVPVLPDAHAALDLSASLEEAAARAAEARSRPWLDALLREAPPGTGHTLVATRHWADTVIHEIRRLEADFVIVGEYPPEIAPDMKPLLRQLPAPLFIARHAQVPRRFAAALGIGADDAPHRLVNQAALEHLVLLVLKFRGEARVLSALPNPIELVPLMGDAYAASYVSADLEAAYRENLVQQVTKFGLADTCLRVAPGRPDVALPEMVRSEHIDCLILGTVCRTGLAAFWLGNTAEDVMPRVDCDLLLLRPQDYFDPS
jgi:universal stress protein E